MPRSLMLAPEQPLDQAALLREIGRFNAGLELKRARTPPASWYTHPRFWALDKAAVLERHWIVAGRAALLDADASYLTLTVGDCPVVVVRDGDRLRAFHNVCRHHAACVAEGAGQLEDRALVCPYHGWRYQLSGKLQSAPRSGGIHMDTDERNLVEVAVAQWGPYVFVCVADDPPDLLTQLQPLTDKLDATGWDRLSYVGSERYEIACNWKVVVDNYLDGGYHVPFAHPALTNEVDMSTYVTTCYDGYSVQTSADNGSTARNAGGVFYTWLHPTFMVNRYGPVLDANLLVPLGPDRCLLVYDYFFEATEGEQAQAFIAESRRRSRVTQEEDTALCERVQRGLRSPAYDQGWYAGSEVSALQFHRLLQADYLATF